VKKLLTVILIITGLIIVFPCTAVFAQDGGDTKVDVVVVTGGDSEVNVTADAGGTLKVSINGDGLATSSSLSQAGQGMGETFQNIRGEMANLLGYLNWLQGGNNKAFSDLQGAIDYLNYALSGATQNLDLTQQGLSKVIDELQNNKQFFDDLRQIDAQQQVVVDKINKSLDILSTELDTLRANLSSVSAIVENQRATLNRYAQSIAAGQADTDALREELKAEVLKLQEAQNRLNSSVLILGVVLVCFAVLFVAIIRSITKRQAVK
jgi:formiminotetrahydrofolate cyclodeaminase